MGYCITTTYAAVASQAYFDIFVDQDKKMMTITVVIMIIITLVFWRMRLLRRGEGGRPSSKLHISS